MDMLRTDFTFHNVSINTREMLNISEGGITLHSTMFLLIHLLRRKSLFRTFCFTFHNVSINTEACQLSLLQSLSFTFHNVSINTIEPMYQNPLKASLHSTMFLLILLLKGSLLPSYKTLHSTMFLLILTGESETPAVCFLYIPQCFY